MLSLADVCIAQQVLSRPVTVRQLGATIREPGYVETEFRVRIGCVHQESIMLLFNLPGVEAAQPDSVRY